MQLLLVCQVVTSTSCIVYYMLPHCWCFQREKLITCHHYFGNFTGYVCQNESYKLATLVFRCLHGIAPPYLANELHLVMDIEGRQRLRSASTVSLVVPSARLSTVGDRAFPVAAARVEQSAATRSAVTIIAGI